MHRLRIVEILEDRTLPSAASPLQIPLSFEANVGQTDAQVQFLARGQGYGLFLTPGEAVLNLYDVHNADDPGTVLRAQIVGANLSAQVVGLDQQAGHANYYLGNDPANWHEGVDLFGRVRYRDIYPGIDLVYYGNSQQQLEYDFIVAPGVDPNIIKVNYQGADSVTLDAQGNLILHTPGGDVVQPAPIIFQENHGVREPVTGSFLLSQGSGGEASIGFDLGAYDPSRPLVIDPALVYSSYHGGSGADDFTDLYADTSGNMYLTGYTRSANFPLTPASRPARDNTLGGTSDAVVISLNPSGTIYFATYLGGAGRENDLAGGGGVGALVWDGNLHVTGYTQSSDFPMAGASLDTTLGGTQDAFVASLGGTGVLIYSTYLGGAGDETGTGISIERNGNRMITGYTSSADFPVQAAVQSTFGGGVDAYVARLNPPGSALVFSTYLGGGGDDFGLDLDVDGSNNIYVTGRTLSGDFPTTAGMDRTLGGTSDAFVAKYNFAGSTQLFSTYLGGGGDENLDPAHGSSGGSLAVESAGNVYVTGSTASGDFPVLGPYDSLLGGSWDAFVAKLDASGTPVYATYLGGGGNDIGLGIAFDASQGTFVIGYTESADFPTVNPIQGTLAGARDAFVTAIDASDFALRYSSYLGGPGGTEGDIGRSIFVDFRDTVYVAGFSDSTAFPTQSPRQAAAGGGGDGFVAKMGVIPGAYVDDGRNVTYLPSESIFQTVYEGGATDTYTFVLTAGPQADVIVTFNTDGQTTTSPALTFTPSNWNVTQTVRVTGFDDSLVEGTWPDGSHTSVITHTTTSADPVFNGLSLPNVSVTVNDNDTPGIYATYGTILRRGIDEAGPTTSNTGFVLTSTPTGDVVITLTPDAQTTLSPSVLTFTPANWYIAQGINVTAVDDAVAEASPHPGLITVAVSSADPTYNVLTVATITASITDNDIPTPPGITTNSSRGIDVTEGAWTETYTIVLNSAPTGDVVMTLTADAQVVVSPSLLTYSPANWNVPQTATVSAVDDLAVEAFFHTGNISYSFSSPDAGYNGLIVPASNVSVTDNDTPGLTRNTSFSVDEAGPTSNTYGVNLQSIPTANVVITINASTQVSASPATMTFTPVNWYIPQSVIITAVDDGIDETSPHSALVNYTATSADPGYNGLAIPVSTANITDNDTAGIFVLDTSGTTNVTEGAATDTYSVRLTSQPAANVIVTLNPGLQLSAAPAPLTFSSANWNIAQTVTVSAVNDSVDETSPATGVISHTSTSADPLYNALTIIDITANITDDDVAGVTIAPSGGSTLLAEAGGTDTYSVVLTSQPTANVVVTLTPDAQVTVSTPVLTFNASNWNVPQTVTLTAVDDFMVETSPHDGTVTHTVASGDPFFSGLPLGGLTANITDNDVGGVAVTQSGGTTSVTEGAATDTYTIVLTSRPSANVIITVTPGTQVTVSAATLTFTPTAWNVLQTVTVTAIDDAVFEGPHTGVITHTPSSADGVYNRVSIGSVTANIADNDAVGVLQSGGSTAVSESGGTDTYTIVLASQPTANVIVTFNPGSQLSVAAGPLTFTPLNWNLPQTATVAAVNDMIAENPHTGVVAHTANSTDPNYNNVVIVNVTAQIADNDTAGVAVAPTGGSTFVSEGVGSDSYTVVLNTQPTANVLVSVAPDPELAAFPGVLTFTPANWNVPQVVTVTAADDGIQQGARTRIIAHAASSTDLFYQGIGVASLTVTVNDPPGLTLTPTGGQNAILEGATISYTAILTTQPTSDVTIDLAPDGQTVLSQVQLVFTPTNWNVPRPVTISALDDSLVEGPHQSTIGLTVTSTDPAYSSLGLSSFVTDVVDNDGEPFLGTSRADQIVITTSVDRSRVQVSLNGKVTTFPASLAQLVVFAGDGNDNVQIHDPVVPISVVGGQGIDKVFVTGAAGANRFLLDSANVRVGTVNVEMWESESLIVSGKTANDIFTVRSMPVFATEFKGDLGNDLVIGGNRLNTWQLTGTSAGTLNRSLKVTGIENWTGGTFADRFVFASGKTLGGQLDGGGGQDVLDYSACTTPITVNLQTSAATGTLGARNITRVVGGRGSADRLIAGDVSNVWSITTLNTGNVNGLAFAGFENLTGGIFDDTFRLADNQGVKGKIDGGGGSDTLDYSAYRTRGVIINLQAKSATNTTGFVNMEAFLAGSNLQDTVVGANLANAWQLTGTGTGAVNGVAFTNFKNLTGGSLTDAFTLLSGGTWDGTLDGGAGKDSLAAYPGVNIWVNSSVTAGTLNGRKFAGVESRR